MPKVFIALGSNLGDAEALFRQAMKALRVVGENLVHSSLYLSRPYGLAAQPDFTNAVLSMETSLSPLELLDELQKVEASAGKVFVQKNGPRTLDLDLIFYEQEILASPNLTIPHPRAHERDFVLLPLAEIAPSFVHPTERKTVLELSKHLQETFVYQVKKTSL